MSDVAVWHGFAYMTGDEHGELDTKKRLADWQLEDWLRHVTTRGFDNIYLSRDPVNTTRFAPGPPPPGFQSP